MMGFPIAVAYLMTGAIIVGMVGKEDVTAAFILFLWPVALLIMIWRGFIKFLEGE